MNSDLCIENLPVTWNQSRKDSVTLEAGISFKLFGLEQSFKGKLPSFNSFKFCLIYLYYRVIYDKVRPCCVFSRVMSPQLSGWPLSGLFTSQHCSCSREEASLCSNSEYHVLNPNILYNSGVSVTVLKLPSVSVSGAECAGFSGDISPALTMG